MELAEKAEGLETTHPERRASTRHGVDEEAALLLVHQGSPVPCRIVDLCLGGCRLRTQERFLAGILVRAEVTFKLNGLAFRICGVTSWTDGRNLVGIRFVDLTARRSHELAELLREVQADHDAKAAIQAAVKLAPESPELQAAMQPQTAQSIRTAPPALPGEKTTGTRIAVASAGPGPSRIVPAASPQPAEAKSNGLLPAKPAKPAPSERRAQARHDVDTSAVILLINVGSELQGRILNLSLGGCRIRTQERFPVGIYTRVETEFRLEGLPFRLGGVIQGIHDRHHVGIRFLDMSDRKRNLLAQLIEEIEELDEREKAEKPAGEAGLG